MRFFAFAVLLSWCAFGHAAEPDAITPDGGRYYGPLKDGKLHGRGRIEWANGAHYEGGLRDGLMSGRGRYRFANGDRYEGEARNGMMNGRGRMQLRDGTVYEGEFRDDAYHGKGRFETPAGEIYEGVFAAGEFTGRGTYSRKDGAFYRGEFQKWRMHGAGRYTDPAGNTYEGRFSNGDLSGPGRFIDKDGRAYAGRFRNWKFEAPEGGDARRERERMLRNVEAALHHQRDALDRALAALAPSDPQAISMYLLAVAGDGSQEVFRREVEYVRAQFDRDFGTRNRSVALVNSRSTAASAPMATVTGIRAALETIAARMNRDKDILFLFLTSHGSQEHELSLHLEGMTLRGLAAQELGELLRQSGIRWKVIVVSACYGGGFIDQVKDERTLVIAAARRDRQSFGCADENEFTYFGRAFFKEALPAAGSFQDAFARAQALVTQWESAERKSAARPAPAGAGKDPASLSLPQIHDPVPIREHLQRWWPRRPE